MDSKHRHQLEQNVLAKWISTQYRDWIRPNSQWLSYAALGVILVVAIFVFTSRINSWNRASSWKQYYAALHSAQPETALEGLTDTVKGEVGEWTRLTLAQQQLTDGCAQLFNDKTKAIPVLEKAVISFLRLQKEARSPEFKQYAGFGLGQCYEALAAARTSNHENQTAGSDDWSRAVKEYEQIAGEENFTGRQAKKQLALLRQPETKNFLQLTAAKKPEKQEEFKVNIDPADPMTPAGTIDLSGFDTPEIPADKPAENKPATDKPAENPPAAEDKPAEENTAAEKTTGETPPEEKKTETPKIIGEKQADEPKAEEPKTEGTAK
ncbi:MAG: hypothetical protein LBH00_11255 [Planctomycetaceae bacterium]|jgi:hypothetical protein|nr:hypothetical protein [Planctomycetaceae bacterium]